ncbi:hypothetical protein [Clostridium hydrogenum]|nr:hypothetical protein [Clostridium hydrogenum]
MRKINVKLTINRQIDYVNKTYERADTDINEKLVTVPDYNKNPELSVILI